MTLKVLITAGAGGIGFATATAFAQSLLNGKDSREAHPSAPQP